MCRYERKVMHKNIYESFSSRIENEVNMHIRNKTKKQMQDTKPVFKFNQNLHHGFETTKLCQ